MHSVTGPLPSDDITSAHSLLISPSSSNRARFASGPPFIDLLRSSFTRLLISMAVCNGEVQCQQPTKFWLAMGAYGSGTQ